MSGRGDANAASGEVENAVGKRAADVSHTALGAELAGTLRAAQERLLSRPHVSIRLRFLTSLIVCVCLFGTMGLLTIHLLGRVRQQLRLLESAEQLAFEIQQARHVEKDSLLAGANLQDSVAHFRLAEALMNGDLSVVRTAAPLTYGELERNMREYSRLLREAPEKRDGERALETALRGNGSEMTRLSEELVAGQDTVVERLLSSAQILPIVFLGLLMILFVLITYFFLHALMDPLRRFQSYTRRIAQGDFSLIGPARPYRDEFSELALAVNRMLAELQANQARGFRTAKLAAVGTITSGIAHELNNPLNNISITTEAFMEEFKTLNDERKWRYLQDIYFETERASEIVKSLLDFTHQEKPDLVPLDISEVLSSTQRLAQNEMALGNVTFEPHFNPGLPRVLGAANQLRQVFLNLFINAVQAMPEGGTLTVRAEVAEDGRVCVDVSDTGSGIPPEVLPHLFTPFFTTKEPGKGTGLGLSVCDSIIKKHSGDICVYSEPGKGTTFHVCLPTEKRTQ